MKATDFVKKHGWEAVIKAVESTNVEETSAFESKDLDPILAKDGGVIGFNCKVYRIPFVEVERLVGSWKLVEKHQGLNGTKNTLKLLQSSLDLGLHHGIEDVNAEAEIPKLKQAIADVEACQ